MSHFPEPVCTEQGIDSLLLPPDTLVAPPMELVVMDTAERHRETIADLAANCPAIGESDVVGVRWGATTDKARLTCNELQMSTVALAHRLFEDGDLLGGWFVRKGLRGSLRTGCSPFWISEVGF